MQLDLKVFRVAIIGLLLLIAADANAQSFNKSADNTFQGRFEVSSDRARQETNGFVTEIEVGFKWAGFFGQPVESYTLRWEKGEEVYLPNGGTLRRSELKSYANLLAQYDNLRITDLTLRAQVNVWDDELSVENIRDTQPHNYSSSGSPYEATGSKIIKRVPHLVIGRAGQVSSYIIPSSPQNTRSFIDWNWLPSGTDGELAAKNTLNMADRLKIGPVFIENIEVPYDALLRIYEQYREREEKTEEDDFWGNEENDLDTAKEDDFWGDGSSSAKTIDDDFWGSNSNSSPTRSKDAFWSEDDTAHVKPKFVHKNNLMGVEDELTGKVIFPYGKWKIVEYRAGLAFVEANYKTELIKKTKIPCNSKHGACVMIFTHNCTYNISYENYWIDKNGHRLTDAKQESYTNTTGC